MATATELADQLHEWFRDGMDIAEVEAELRRIPDLEQRIADAERWALTDDDIGELSCIAEELKLLAGPMGLAFGLRIESRIARLTPPPQVEWTDVGEGSIAELDGWTLTVRPASDSCERFVSTARKLRSGDGFDSTLRPTIDAAKSAAVEWVKQRKGE